MPAAAARARRARLGVRQRAIQLGLVGVGLALVVVADALAEQILVVDPGAGSARLHALLVLGGRVVAGWATGLAFRLQLAPSADPDEQLRTALGVPLGFLCAWPLVLSALPSGLVGALPPWLVSGPAVEVQPVAAVVFGVVLALSVTVRRARR